MVAVLSACGGSTNPTSTNLDTDTDTSQSTAFAESIVADGQHFYGLDFLYNNGITYNDINIADSSFASFTFNMDSLAFEAQESVGNDLVAVNGAWVSEVTVGQTFSLMNGTVQLVLPAVEATLSEDTVIDVSGQSLMAYRDALEEAVALGLDDFSLERMNELLASLNTTVTLSALTFPEGAKLYRVEVNFEQTGLDLYLDDNGEVDEILLVEGQSIASMIAEINQLTGTQTLTVGDGYNAEYFAANGQVQPNGSDGAWEVLTVSGMEVIKITKNETWENADGEMQSDSYNSCVVEYHNNLYSIGCLNAGKAMDLYLNNIALDALISGFTTAITEAVNAQNASGG